MPDTKPTPVPAITSILSFFLQPTLTIVIRATYQDGKVSWPHVIGAVLDHDTTGLLLRDVNGAVRFLPWSIVVSIRPGVQTAGDW